MSDQDLPTDAAEAEVPTVRSAQDVSGEVEALLLVAEEPISEDALAEAIDVPRSMIEECLAELVAFYDETGRGFELRQLGGGWRYYTREEHADLVARYALAPQQSSSLKLRWRRWPLSPIPSRSPAVGFRPFGASTSTG